MHYLIVYGENESKEFEEWKIAVRNRHQFYKVRDLS